MITDIVRVAVQNLFAERSDKDYYSAVVYQLRKRANPTAHYIHINITRPEWTRTEVLKHFGMDASSVDPADGVHIVKTYINVPLTDAEYRKFEEKLKSKYHPVRIAGDM